jgi:anaerobic magnesium-protoporphyrin IX monomethyl ester cyclase
LDVLLISAPPKLKNGFGTNVLQMELTASCLGKKGFTTEIFDESAYDLTPRQLANIILRKKCSLLGCFMSQDSVLTNLRVIRKLREAGWVGHVTLLGDYASRIYKTLLSNQCGIDSIVIGRDELVLMELAKKGLTGENWQSTSGLAFFSATEGIVVNKGGNRAVESTTVRPPAARVYANLPKVNDFLKL